MSNIIKIGLLGCGTVGTGVIKVLEENLDEITPRVGAQLTISRILVRDMKKKRQLPGNAVITDNIDDILNDPEIKIVIELLGGIHPAREYMLKALQAGKNVVTANKDVVAQFGKDMFAAAEKSNVDFMFEASVGGGIPIITPLKQCLTANKLTEVIGIVNGTTNYMLTKMSEENANYDEVLKAAQEKGYAEADPTADVEGLDAARKTAILASIAFNSRVGLDKVYTEGITKITPEDIAYAKELGYTIKLLSVSRDGEKGIDVRVHPALLPQSHPLAAVRNEFNAIFVKGNAVGETMFYGRGAGQLPTASAVLADVIDVARDIVKGHFGKIRCTCYEHKTFCPIEKTTSSYYVRLLVDDQPGVLGAIAMAFGQTGVSLNAVIQKRKVKNNAEIVAITHVVQEAKIRKAEQVLNKLPAVDKICNVIRVEGPTCQEG
ncbi:homoserine dehydrogenase [Pectinatus cerevisiiphilus]|uniref:Homoserine dehydrogenase n=1 Tax=Pectinatus cerevisiiphilus TaxID=86956 RepID=A0A4R3K467_9FIRM|nr:homoserine dehydrogenase [Pectinatus cerevisiiphilus]TCS77516.1 homoserine dehydrogenase [Pectinatus cerevisiiphilus]